ncbi:MAG: TIGR02996 domain-containing protein [Myxococcales bacterium]|nr:TIGR02996 domain-containing protein [Myxococcales bacterium]
MSLKEQLWAAARESPDDDAHRLVIADWLQDRGQSDRAAFVRLQVLRGQLPDDDAEQITLELQERPLRTRSEQRWRGELPAIDGVRWGRFERGFVRRVAFESVAHAHAHLAACVDATLVQGVALPWPRLGSPEPLPAQEGVRELIVTGTLVDDTDADWLAASPMLSGVRRLTLLGSRIGAEELLRILGSPHLKQLEQLALPHHALDAQGIQVLVERDLRGLVELDLSALTQEQLGSGGRDAPTIGPEGAVRLADWEGMASVRRLMLTGQQFQEAGLAALLASPHLADLQHLAISGTADWDWETDLRPDVMAAFRHASKELSLSSLELGELELTVANVAALADGGAADALRTLVIDRQFEEQPLNALARLPFVSTLRRLEVLNVAQDGFFGELLAQPLPELHSLITFSAFHWSRQPALVGLLSRAPGLPTLRRLGLSDDALLSDEVVEQLGRIDTMPALEELWLASGALWNNGNTMSEEAAGAFLVSPLGRRLTSVQLPVDGLDRLPAPTNPSLLKANRAFLGEW